MGIVPLDCARGIAGCEGEGAGATGMPKAWVRAEANWGPGATGCCPEGVRKALGGVVPPKPPPCPAGTPTPDVARGGACGSPVPLAGRGAAGPGLGAVSC